MTAEQLANTPVRLTIDGVDASGEPAVRTFALCRSLPADSAIALDRDLIDLGKRELNPYQQSKPQLDALAAMAKAADSPEERVALLSDRQAILNRISDHILSGLADEMMAEKYFQAGRATVEGLTREIAERATLAGQTVPLAELRAIVTTGNVGLVLKNLVAALGDKADPTTPAT